MQYRNLKPMCFIDDIGFHTIDEIVDLKPLIRDQYMQYPTARHKPRQ